MTFLSECHAKWTSHQPYSPMHKKRTGLISNDSFLSQLMQKPEQVTKDSFGVAHFLPKRM